MLTSLTRWLRPSRAARPRTALTRVIEALEDRVVPDATLFPLATGAYSQTWGGLINVNSFNAGWTTAGQSSVEGYFSSAGNIAPAPPPTAGNAGTVTGASTNLNLDVNVGTQTPTQFTVGSGVAAFYPNQAGGDAMIALKPSAANPSPNLVFYVDTTGVADVFVSYRLRDLDTSTNATESVALQWRAGNTGPFQNVPVAYQADGTIGRDIAVSGRLPAGASGLPAVQVRIITTRPSGGGAGEWVGVDDISIVGNQPPTVTPSGGLTVYQEPLGIGTTGRQIVDGGMQVADPDQAVFYDVVDGVPGSLTVSVTTNAGPTDAVTINNQGSGAGQIGLVGTTVTFGGTAIGTVAGLATGTMTVTFNGAATTAAVQALARQVVFQNSSDTPMRTTRTVQFVFDDGRGGSATVTKGVDVQDRNDTPTLTLPATGPSTYEGVPVTITGVSVNDVDLLAGKLRLVVTVGRTPTGTISYTRSGAETVTYNATNTRVTVLGTIAEINAALVSGLKFIPDPGYNTAGDLPVPLNFALDDQGNTGFIPDLTQPVQGTLQVIVNQVNHPTDVALESPATGKAGDPVPALDYPLNAAPILIAPNATVTDVDYPKAADLNGGVLTVKVVQGASPDNLLRIRSQGFNPGQIGLQGAFPNTSVVYTYPSAGPGQPPLSVIVGQVTSSGTGTLPLQVTFSGTSATPDVVQAVVRNILFGTTGTSFDSSQRVIQIDLTDGDGPGAPPDQVIATTFPTTLYYADNDTFRTVNPLQVNNAPTFTIAADPPAVNEDAGAVAVAGFATNISPGPAPYEQAQALTFNVTGNTNTGLFAAGPSIDAAGALTYTPAAHASGTATVTVVLKDDGSGTAPGGTDTSAPVTFTITVNPVADPPLVTGPLATTEDPPTGPTITVTRAAVDGPEVKYVKVTNVHGGTLALAGGGAVADGTFLDITAAAAQLVFTPSLNANDLNTPAGFGFDATGALTLTDTAGGTTPVVITVSPVDDAPVVGGLPASTGYLVGQNPVPVAPAATVSDIDSADFNGGSLTVGYSGGTGQTGDTLAVQTGGLVDVSGSFVSYNGSVVGTVSGGSNGGPLTVTFTAAAATPAAAAAVLQSVVFSASSNPVDRVLVVTVDDGDGATSDPAMTAVRVTDQVQAVSLVTADPSPTRAPAPSDLHWTLTTDLPAPAGGGFALTNFALTGTLKDLATLSAVTRDDGLTYTITATLSPAAGSGTLGLQVVNAAGLGVTLGTPLPFDGGPGGVYDVDRVGPQVVPNGFTNSSTAGKDVPVNQPVTYTVTFDEPVDPGTVSAAGFRNAGTATAGIALVGVAGKVVTLAVTPTTAGTVHLQLKSAAVADLLGNFNSAAYTDSAVLTVDATLPTVSSVTNVTAGGVTNVVGPLQNVTYTVTFSELMDAATVRAAAFSNGAAATPAPVTVTSVTPTTGSSTTFTVVVQPTAVGLLQLRVGTAAADVAGNPLAATYTDPTVVVVNRPPTAVADTYAAVEDTPLVADVTRGVRANDTDPNDPVSSLTVTPLSLPTKGTLALAADGSFTYTPFRDANGGDVFTYQVTDPHGGSAIGTATINITPVNDPPTFTLAPTSVTVPEDSGAYGPTTVASQLAGGGTGAYVENDVFALFTVTVLSADPTLTFSSAPAVTLFGSPGSQVGRLTFTPAPNAFGSATLQVTLTDAGSNSVPNNNTSAPQTLTINVTPVNDAPSFTLFSAATNSSNPPVAGPGPQAVPNFATFNPGPNEQTLGQTPTYTLTPLGTSGSLAFATGPTIDATGTLVYEAAPGTTGTATYQVAVKDSGGTANGGKDTGTFTQTFTIVVLAQSALPTAADDGSLIPKDAPATFIDVLSNDTPAANGSRTLTVVSVTQPAHGTAAVAPGGRGVLYTPAPGFTGSDSFTYTLNDGNGGPASATVDVTVRPVPAGQPRFDVAALGTGPGGGPVVRVSGLTTGSYTATFYAYDPSFRGGVSVAVGDVNGDGVPDVVVTPGAGGGPHVKVIDGTKLGLVDDNGEISDAAVLYSYFAYAPTFTGGVNVAAADVDGDGKADIITGTGAGGGAQVRVMSGADLHQLASFFAYDASFRGGVNVAAGDVDGDGKADIVTAAGAGGGSHVKVFNALGGQPLLRSFFAYGAGFSGGVNVAVGDVNGDGKADIITGAGVGGGPHVKVFDSSATELASFFALTGGAAGADVAFRVTKLGVPLVVVSGQRGPSEVRTYAAPDFLPYNSLTPFEDTFLGGVDVG